MAKTIDITEKLDFEKSPKIDITEKLDFEESPKIIIKGEEISINDDATTMLKTMQLLGDGDGSNVGVQEIIAIYELLFDETERTKIDKLKLKFKNFQILVSTAISLVTGTGDTVGE